MADRGPDLRCPDMSCPWVYRPGVDDPAIVQEHLAKHRTARVPSSVWCCCGMCSECQRGAACTAPLRLLPLDGGEDLAARVVAALGFINRMRGVDSNVDAVLTQVQRLLTQPATAPSDASTP